MRQIVIDTKNNKDQRTEISIGSNGKITVRKWEHKTDKSCIIAEAKNCIRDSFMFHLYKGDHYIGNGSTDLMNIQTKKIIINIDEIMNDVMDTIDIYI